MLWATLARLARRGYQPIPREPGADRAAWWVIDETHGRRASYGETVDRLSALSGGIIMVLPTTVRFGASAAARQVRHVIEQLREARASAVNVPLLLIVAIQWHDGQTEDAAAALVDHALTASSGIVGADDAIHDVAVVGLTLRGPQKVRTLRNAITLARDLGVLGVGWMDDDVQLDPGCLARLISHFLALDGSRVVGATKIPHRRTELTSRLLFQVKEVMQPATNYPHGCCMLVDASLLERGIPERYVCDDGYFCFEMLRRADWEERLALVPQATCHYLVGAESGQMAARLRRVLLNHSIFLVDYPPDVALRYLGHMLYPGFWPVSRARGGASVPVAMSRWVLQALHFACLTATLLGLAGRGLVGRPLREIRTGRNPVGIT